MRIAWKIFGISIIVLAVMTVASIYSIQKMSGINRELHVISNVFAPLSHDITRIEIVVLEEQVSLERIEKYQAELRASQTHPLNAVEPAGGTAPNPSAHDLKLKNLLSRETAEMEGRNAEVERLLASAEQRVKDAQDTASDLAQRLELAGLLPRFVAIEAQHANFHSHASNLVTAAGLAPEVRETLEQQLSEEENKLTQRLDQLREHIAEFTSEAIATAARHEEQALIASVAATSAAGILALILSWIVISGILRPMRALSAGARKVEQGDFTVELTPRSSDEIGALTRSFNTMVDGLQSTQKIKDTFGQYVDPRVVSDLIGETEEATGGEKKVVTAYFSDLADFTTISEQFTPTALVRLLNRYLDLMSSEITERDGVIDKYIGDAVMAFWAQPFCPDGDQATLAVRSAMRNMELIAGFQSELPELTGLNRNIPALHQRIGIATGEAVIGSIGSEKTKNYTVMGDTVNLGARLEGANKIYGTQLLVCEKTRDMSSGIEFRAIDRILVKGRSEPTNAYTALCETGKLTEPLRDLQTRSEDALEAFRLADWEQARSLFQAIVSEFPDDPVAPVFLNRLEIIAAQGSPENWTGVWQLTSK